MLTDSAPFRHVFKSGVSDRWVLAVSMDAWDVVVLNVAVVNFPATR